MAKVRALKESYLSARITARTRFGLALVARAQNSTIATAANWCFDRLFATSSTADSANEWPPFKGIQPGALLDLVWSPHEHERFALLGEHYPRLLRDNEQYLWRELQAMPEYWKQTPTKSAGGKAVPGPIARKIDLEKLGTNWAKLKEKACLED